MRISHKLVPNKHMPLSPWITFHNCKQIQKQRLILSCLPNCQFDEMRRSHLKDPPQICKKQTASVPKSPLARNFRYARCFNTRVLRGKVRTSLENSQGRYFTLEKTNKRNFKRYRQKGSLNSKPRNSLRSNI